MAHRGATRKKQSIQKGRILINKSNINNNNCRGEKKSIKIGKNLFVAVKVHKMTCHWFIPSIKPF